MLNSTVVDNRTVVIPRLSSKDFNKVVKLSPDGMFYITPDAHGSTLKSPRILRPKLSLPLETKCSLYSEISSHDSITSEMRLLDSYKNTFMWNKAVQEHSKTDCEMLNLSIHKEVKKGLCWIQTLKCTNCKYCSAPVKLYQEVITKSPGPRSAAPNLALQVALQDTSISNTKARLLLAATNTPPPCRSSMQKAANKVGDIITDVNEADMTHRREESKRINQLRGVDNTESRIQKGFDGSNA